jgi:hypothetical protein
MSYYRKKPVIIEARQYVGTASQTHDVYLWVEENTLGSFEPLDVITGRVPCPASGVSIDPRDGRMMIATLEGPHWVNVGDYVIRGVRGEFYPCKPDIFEATYEGDAERLADWIDRLKATLSRVEALAEEWHWKDPGEPPAPEWEILDAASADLRRVLTGEEADHG